MHACATTPSQSRLGLGCFLPRHEAPSKEINGPHSTYFSSFSGPGDHHWGSTRNLKSAWLPQVTNLQPTNIGPVGRQLESLRLFAAAAETNSAVGRLAWRRRFGGRGMAQIMAAKGDASPTIQTIDELEDDVCELVSGKELELTSSVTFGAYLVEPKKNDNGAGILLLTDIFGQENEDNRGYANRLGCFGYSVLVPDLFRGKPWDPKRSQTEYEGWRAKHTAENFAEDISAASRFLADFVEAKQLKPGQGRLALLGFCLGGGRAIETLASDGTTGAFSTGVSFYGARYDPELASQIRAPTLLLLGDMDEKSPVKIAEEVAKRLKKQGVENRVVVYEGRGHAFAHRPADMAEDQDSEDAFLLVKEWLNAHLLSGPT